MNGLEAIEKLRQLLAYEIDGINFMNEVEVIKKELKALEIIKKKRVDLDLLLKTFKFNNYELYNFNIGNGARSLTQEEYDLLKEVLS